MMTAIIVAIVDTVNIIHVGISGIVVVTSGLRVTTGVCVVSGNLVRCS